MGTQNKKSSYILGVGRIVLGKGTWIRIGIQILLVGALRFCLHHQESINNLNLRHFGFAA